MNRIVHYLFLIEINLLILLASFVALFKKKNKGNKRILTLPYYSQNYAGGQSRIGEWKSLFEKEGWDFSIHWASEEKEFLSEFYSKNPFVRYYFFHKVLLRRINILFQLNKYESVWIQRSLVPFYPFKNAYFERIASKINKNISYDFYDADYESNYNLTIQTARLAKNVTVASLYLKDYFKKLNIKSTHIPFAIKFDDYLSKKIESNKIIIGWQGSPGNFVHVKSIEKELLAIENKFPQVEFHFICRENPKMELKRCFFSKWGDEGFDYFVKISTFDIGLAPMLIAGEREKAKTAFKSLEYMASSISFVTSPWGISDQLKHGENCLFAPTKEDWFFQVEKLVSDRNLRANLGLKARKCMEEHHSYEKVFPLLIKTICS